MEKMSAGKVYALQLLKESWMEYMEAKMQAGPVG
jgi:hypothetical protein